MEWRFLGMFAAWAMIQVSGFTYGHHIAKSAVSGEPFYNEMASVSTYRFEGGAETIPIDVSSSVREKAVLCHPILLERRRSTSSHQSTHPLMPILGPEYYGQIWYSTSFFSLRVKTSPVFLTKRGEFPSEEYSATRPLFGV